MKTHIAGRTTTARLAYLCLAVALTACGGEGGSSPTPPAPAPGPTPAPTPAHQITISAQPQGGTAATDGSLSMSVTATSDYPLSYQWSRDGVAIAGATTSSLSLSALALGDDGATFVVHIANSATAVDSAAATAHVVAGTGVTVFAGRIGGAGATDGPGATARLGSPWNGSGAVADGSGGAYFVDSMNHTVRRVTAGGSVVTIAGAAGQVGEVDGTGTAARFSWPRAIARDAAGNLYVGETWAIRKITPTGLVTTLAGGARNGAVDGTGAAASFSFINALTADASGKLYVGDDDLIRVVTPGGVVTTLAGGGSGAQDGTGRNATFSDVINSMVIDADGNVVAFDQGYGQLRKITPAGVVTTLSGVHGFRLANVDGPATSARFELLSTLVVDADGGLVVFGSDGEGGPVRLRHVAADGSVTTTAADIGAAATEVEGAAANATGFTVFATNLDAALRVDTTGHATVLAGQAPASGDVDAKGSLARLSAPSHLVVDSAGVAWFIDQDGGAIRRLHPDGSVDTYNASGRDTLAASRLAVEAAGTALVLRANAEVSRVAADGTLTAILEASALAPSSPYIADMALTASGDLLLCSSAGLFKRSAAGVVTTVNTQASCWNVATNAAGRIVEVTIDGIAYDATTPGTTTRLAGGTAGFADGTGPAARFASEEIFFNSSFAQTALALDDAGNAWFIDAENNGAVREITPTGVVTTVVGGPGAVPQVALGAAGTLHAPAGIAIRPGSNGKQLLVTDYVENAVLVYQLP